VTGCDVLWAVCGERGAVYRAVRRCACSDACAVRSGRCCAGRRAGARDVCLHVALECVMCGAWLVGVRCFG
jgi:hypothetical protein